MKASKAWLLLFVITILALVSALVEDIRKDTVARKESREGSKSSTNNQDEVERFDAGFANHATDRNDDGTPVNDVDQVPISETGTTSMELSDHETVHEIRTGDIAEQRGQRENGETTQIPVKSVSDVGENVQDPTVLPSRAAEGHHAEELPRAPEIGTTLSDVRVVDTNTAPNPSPEESRVHNTGASPSAHKPVAKRVTELVEKMHGLVATQLADSEVASTESDGNTLADATADGLDDAFATKHQPSQTPSPMASVVASGPDHEDASNPPRDDAVPDDNLTTTPGMDDHNVADTEETSTKPAHATNIEPSSMNTTQPIVAGEQPTDGSSGANTGEDDLDVFVPLQAWKEQRIQDIQERAQAQKERMMNAQVTENGVNSSGNIDNPENNGMDIDSQLTMAPTSITGHDIYQFHPVQRQSLMNVYVLSLLAEQTEMKCVCFVANESMHDVDRQRKRREVVDMNGEESTPETDGSLLDGNVIGKEVHVEVVEVPSENAGRLRSMVASAFDDSDHTPESLPTHTRNVPSGEGAPSHDQATDTAEHMTKTTSEPKASTSMQPVSSPATDSTDSRNADIQEDILMQRNDFEHTEQSRTVAERAANNMGVLKTNDALVSSFVPALASFLHSALYGIMSDIKDPEVQRVTQRTGIYSWIHRLVGMGALDFKGASTESKPAGQIYAEAEQNILNGAHEASSSLFEPVAHGSVDAGTHLPQWDMSAAQDKPYNFASVDAGARVLASSPGAVGSKNTLTSNPDQYMLVPCAGDPRDGTRWIDVELSEEAVVTSVEAANFEFYSSFPERIAVLGSATYPTSEWNTLGVYKFRNVRDVQRFDIASRAVARYLRVIFVGKQGTEYYCPISVVRAFGKTLIADWKDALKPQPPQAARPGTEPSSSGAPQNKDAPHSGRRGTDAGRTASASDSNQPDKPRAETDIADPVESGLSKDPSGSQAQVESEYMSVSVESATGEEITSSAAHVENRKAATEASEPGLQSTHAGSHGRSASASPDVPETVAADGDERDSATRLSTASAGQDTGSVPPTASVAPEPTEGVCTGESCATASPNGSPSGPSQIPLPMHNQTQDSPAIDSVNANELTDEDLSLLSALQEEQQSPASSEENVFRKVTRMIRILEANQSLTNQYIDTHLARYASALAVARAEATAARQEAALVRSQMVSLLSSTQESYEKMTAASFKRDILLAVLLALVILLLCAQWIRWGTMTNSQIVTMQNEHMPLTYPSNPTSTAMDGSEMSSVNEAESRRRRRRTRDRRRNSQQNSASSHGSLPVRNLPQQQQTKPPLRQPTLSAFQPISRDSSVDDSVGAQLASLAADPRPPMFSKNPFSVLSITDQGDVDCEHVPRSPIPRSRSVGMVAQLSPK